MSAFTRGAEDGEAGGETGEQPSGATLDWPGSIGHSYPLAPHELG